MPPRRALTIAILSYDRPHYLSQTLTSLAGQIGPADRVVVFQDGAWSPARRTWKTRPETVELCARLCAALLPGRSVFSSPFNLGIAGNYRRAEDYVFEALGAEDAIFLEDDMVLAPSYLDIMAQLLAFAAADDRIGYVSAYGDFWASLEDQRRRAGRLAPMHENWGAGLTRGSWEKQKAVRDGYWAVIKDADYSDRDYGRIKAYFASLGFPNMEISSQDGSRWIACAVAGLARITTTTCHARYLGEAGEHFTADHYRFCRFADSVMYPDLPALRAPRGAELDRWIGAERKKLRTGYRHAYIERLRKEASAADAGGESCATAPECTRSASTASRRPRSRPSPKARGSSRR